MDGKYREELKPELEAISESGLYKSEHHITSAQQARISVGDKQMLNRWSPRAKRAYAFRFPLLI
jgi:hypothetical protein